MHYSKQSIFDDRRMFTQNARNESMITKFLQLSFHILQNFPHLNQLNTSHGKLYCTKQFVQHAAYDFGKVRRVACYTHTLTRFENCNNFENNR